MIQIVIGIDIDGVVNDLTLFHISCGTKYCIENKIPYHIFSSYMDSTDIFQWSVQVDETFWNQYYLQLLLYPDFVRPFVSKVTKLLIEEGHTLIFITARKDQDLPSHESHSMFNITSRYLNENQIYYSELVLSSYKEKIINSKKIDIMIEDNPNFFQKYSSLQNISLLCFDTPYNTQVSGQNIKRVYSWYDILQKIHLEERNSNDYRKKFS